MKTTLRKIEDEAWWDLWDAIRVDEAPDIPNELVDGLCALIHKADPLHAMLLGELARVEAVQRVITEVGFLDVAFLRANMTAVG